MITASSTVRKQITDVHEWQRLGEANIFAPNARIELIEGEILDMAPIGFYYAGHLNRLNNVFDLFSGRASHYLRTKSVTLK